MSFCNGEEKLKIVKILFMLALVFLALGSATMAQLEPPDQGFDIEAQMREDGQVRFLITKDGGVVEATCVYTYTLPGQGLEDVREEPHWGEHNCAVPENVPWMQLNEWRSGEISDGQRPEAVYLLVRGNEGGWQEAEDINLTKVILNGYWVAKAKVPFALYTSNDDFRALVEDGEIQRDQEFVILSQEGEWSLIIRYFDGLPGWIQTENLELATTFTDYDHQYGNECRSIPVSVEKQGGFFDEWLHELKFDLNLGDLEEWTLNFKGNELERDDDYRSIAGSPATFELARSWLVVNGLFDIVQDRDWRVGYRWSLVYSCEG